MEDILKKAEEYKKTSAIISRAHYIAWEGATSRKKLLGVPVEYSGNNPERQAALSALEKLVKDSDELAKKTPSIPDKLYYSAKKELRSESESLLFPATTNRE